MFRMSIVEAHGQRKLVLEGKLTPTWTTEIEAAWNNAEEDAQGRKPIIDMTNVTFISPDAQDILFKLMRQGARFSCRDVLTKHVLKQLARRCGCRS